MIKRKTIIKFVLSVLFVLPFLGQQIKAEGTIDDSDKEALYETFKTVTKTLSREDVAVVGQLYQNSSGPYSIWHDEIRATWGDSISIKDDNPNASLMDCLDFYEVENEDVLQPTSSNYFKALKSGITYLVFRTVDEKEKTLYFTKLKVNVYDINLSKKEYNITMGYRAKIDTTGIEPEVANRLYWKNSEDYESEIASVRNGYIYGNNTVGAVEETVYITPYLLKWPDIDPYDGYPLNNQKIKVTVECFEDDLYQGEVKLQDCYEIGGSKGVKPEVEVIGDLKITNIVDYVDEFGIENPEIAYLENGMIMPGIKAGTTYYSCNVEVEINAANEDKYGNERFRAIEPWLTSRPLKTKIVNTKPNYNLFKTVTKTLNRADVAVVGQPYYNSSGPYSVWYDEIRATWGDTIPLNSDLSNDPLTNCLEFYEVENEDVLQYISRNNFKVLKSGTAYIVFRTVDENAQTIYYTRLKVNAYDIKLSKKDYNVTMGYRAKIDTTGIDSEVVNRLYWHNTQEYESEIAVVRNGYIYGNNTVGAVEETVYITPYLLRWPDIDPYDGYPLNSQKIKVTVECFEDDLYQGEVKLKDSYEIGGSNGVKPEVEVVGNLKVTSIIDSVDECGIENPEIAYLENGVIMPGIKAGTTNYTCNVEIAISAANEDKYGNERFRAIEPQLTMRTLKTKIVNTEPNYKKFAVELKLAVKSKKPYLTWSQNNNAIGYEVYRSTKPTTGFKKIATIKKATTLSYTDKKAKAGATYYYKVRPVYEVTKKWKKIVNVGEYGNVESFFLFKNAPKLTLKKGVLSWKKVAGATSYEVYRSTSKSGTYELLNTTTGLKYTDTTGKVGVTYYYKVRAVHKVGEEVLYSGYSSIKSAKKELSVPTIKSATYSSGTNVITVKLNPVKEADVKYDIQVSTKKNKGFKSVTGEELTGLYDVTKKGTYYFKARAYVTIDGKNYYSKFSRVKTVKIKKYVPVPKIVAKWDGETVYITETGTKYHLYHDCQGLSNSNKILQTKLDDYTKAHYGLCSFCAKR